MLHFSFIRLQLANFWTFGLDKFNTSIFLRLRLPPECRILVLGNAVISKIFLRTRKIMVMHSNETGECDLHTLVDRQQKR